MRIKKGREISIEADFDGLDVVAKHGDREIGRFRFDEIECDKSMSFVKLMHIAVNEEYQHAGIATEMMKAAVDSHGQNFSRLLISAFGGRHAAAEDYFTEEGAGSGIALLRKFSIRIQNKMKVRTPRKIGTDNKVRLSCCTSTALSLCCFF